MAKRKINLTKAVSERRMEVDRYYQLIALNLGLKFYLDKYDLNCKFIGSEIDLKRQNLGQKEKPLRPDIILQSVNPQIGLPIEVKTSMSTDEDIEEELIKMKRYDETLSGWATTTGNVQDHKIIFCAYHDDIGRTRTVMNTLMKNGKLNTTKQFFLLDWGHLTAFKTESRDILSIMQINTDVSFNEPELSKLDSQIKRGIQIDTSDPQISELSGIIKFTRMKPQVIEYTMIELRANLLQRFCNEQNDFTTTVKEVVEYINNIESPLMKNSDNHRFKIKDDWIQEAFDRLVSIGLGMNLGGGKYKFFYDKRIRNLEKYIYTESAKLDIKKRVYREHKQAKLKVIDLSENMEKNLKNKSGVAGI